MRRVTSSLVLAIAFALPSPSYAALPSAPSNVSVTSTSVTGTLLNEATARVSWSTVNNAIGYIVRYRTGSDSFTAIYVNNPTGSQTQVEGLTGGRSYTFSVSSYNVDGERAADSVTFTPISVPASPDVTSAEPGVGQVTLKWAAAASDETGGSALTGYLIESDQGRIETVSATSTEKSVTGLTAGSTHRFTIRAINSLGYSTASTFEQVTVLNSPGQPSAVTISNSVRSITAEWSAPTSDGGTPLTGYKAYLIKASDGTDVDSATTNATTRTVTFSNVANGTYHVKVLASNIAGDGLRSLASSDVIIDITIQLADNTPVFVPSTVRNLQVDGTVNFSVTAPSGETPTVTLTATPVNACTYQSNVLTAVAGGTCELRAIVAASGSYASGDTRLVVTVTKVSQSITFPAIGDQSSPGTIQLTAVASSALTVTYSATGNCTVVGSTLTTLTGVCTVIAGQVGNGRFAPAPSISRAFQVGAGATGGGVAIMGGGTTNVVSGIASSSTIQDTATSAGPVLILIQPIAATSTDDITREEICILVRSRVALTPVSIEKCGQSSPILDFSLRDGEYQLTVFDRDRKRRSTNFSLSVVKSEVTIVSANYLSEVKTFQVRVGSTIQIESGPETSTAIGSRVPSQTSSDSGSSTTVLPDSSTAKTESPSDQKPEMTDKGAVPNAATRIVKNVKSNLPQLRTKEFFTVPFAKKVSQIVLSAGVTRAQVTSGQLIQLQVNSPGKGIRVRFEISRKGGMKRLLVEVRSKKQGRVSGQILQFTRPGEYRVLITAGKANSRLNLSVKKKS